jgi:N6-adenosine-specific RNA methylase IME4
MIRIDEEFKKLIPPLTTEELSQLEQNILSEGIRDKICTWQGLIIDGHNRYSIAVKHELLFETIEKEFASREDVKIWIIKNQFGRRNISAYDRSRLALELEPLISAKYEQSRKDKVSHYRQTGEVSQKSDAPDTKKELATIAGVSHDTIAKVKHIEQKATPEVKEKLSTGEVSINQAYQDIKKEEKKEQLEQKKQEYTERVKEAAETGSDMKVDIFDTDKKFRIIYADPPWQYDLEQTSPQLGGAIKHYDSMSIEELCELPINEITEKDAVLFLWITSPKLNLFLELMTAWGFEYKTSFVWDKIKHNMGHYNSVRHEFLLIGGKGKSAPDVKKLFDSVQSIERSDKHSEKPIEFMDIIDELYIHGDRIELFCREPKKENWFSWGNEI